MPSHSAKRRKTSHDSASDEEDHASFASFSDNEEENSALPGATTSESANELDDGGSESDIESDASGEAPTNKPHQNGGPTKSSRDESMQHRKQHSRSSVPASNIGSGGSTFKSTTFKLQTDELLDQVRPRHGKREISAETALHALKKSIEAIPERKPMLLAEAEKELILHKVAVPFPNPPPQRDAKYKFEYAKPTNINVVGSFPIKTSAWTKNALEVDMVVVMPSKILEEKDYLNYRYFYKRAYYLACIAVGLRSALGNEYSFRFKQHHDNPLKPILVVQPVEQSGQKSQISAQPTWKINIVICTASDQFAALKLGLDKNCIRAVSSPGAESLETTATPTPFYNASVQSDALMLSYLKLLHATAKSCASFLDVCLLGSIWLHQRGFQAAMSEGGFGSFEWSALIALALTGGGTKGKPLLSDGHSSYQLFKAVLQLFAVKDFTKTPLVIGEIDSDCHIPAKKSPIVWDGVRNHNILYKVSKSTYKMLRHEAKLTLNTLNDQHIDGFQQTFIHRVQQPLYRFESILRLPTLSLLKGKSFSDLAQLSHMEKVYEILRKGLGDRVFAIGLRREASPSWKLGSARPGVTQRDGIVVGFVVNPATVRRTVDHGPDAESKQEAAEFREFWGSKAELRRFRDGSIQESLVWSVEENGTSVFEQIIRHLMAHHFGDSALEGLEVLGDDFDTLIRAGHSTAAFEPMMEKFKRLESDIRGLDDFPLSFRQVMPSDPQLRYTSVRIPTTGPLTQQVDMPASVILQFESSTRWPDDIAAIQRTKIAFLLKLEELLTAENSSITCRIGLENEDHDTLNQAFLDITYDLHTSFRIRIYHDREQSLFSRQLQNKTTDPQTRETAAKGLASHKRDYIQSPAHTQAFTRLCTRHPALSGAIRLTKKWFAAHLLSNHICDETIELFVANTFLNPWPWGVPGSIQTAFLRTLLWLSRWDWRTQPLILDLSDSRSALTPALRQSIATRFAAWRNLDPDMHRLSLFVASNVDPEGSTYTDPRPARVLAARMSALAKAACAHAEAAQILQPLDLFASPLSDFDFALHLNPAMLPTASQLRASKATPYKNLELSTALDSDAHLAFDPLGTFLAELEQIYASVIVFCSSGVETRDPVIAGLWNPVASAPRPWKVNLAHSTVPRRAESWAKDSGKRIARGDNDGMQGEENGTESFVAMRNSAAILAEIARLGGDLILRVEAFEK